MTQYLLIGEVLKPQGIRGEAKVKPYAADPEDFARWHTLYLLRDGQWTPIASRCKRIHDGFVYLFLEGCTTPEDVDRLRGEKLFIDRTHASPLAEGEYYLCDLVGLKGIDQNGNEIGTLKEVLQHGAADVYVFQTSRGIMMAPALKAVFPQVDMDKQCILVDADRLAEVAVYED